MRLLLEEGEVFSNSSARVQIAPAASGDPANRIFVAVKFGPQKTTAILDTGAPYSICAPAFVPMLDIDPSAGLSTEKITIRGLTVSGQLHRMQMTLLSDEGGDVPIDATVFIPSLLPGETWTDDLCFIGYGGALERIRFALDSQKENFYFNDGSA